MRRPDGAIASMWLACFLVKSTADSARKAAIRDVLGEYCRARCTLWCGIERKCRRMHLADHNRVPASRIILHIETDGNGRRLLGLPSAGATKARPPGRRSLLRSFVRLFMLRARAHRPIEWWDIFPGTSSAQDSRPWDRLRKWCDK